MFDKDRRWSLFYRLPMPGVWTAKQDPIMVPDWLAALNLRRFAAAASCQPVTEQAQQNDSAPPPPTTTLYWLRVFVLELLN